MLDLNTQQEQGANAPRVIDGKASAARLRAQTASAAARFRMKTGRRPGLAVILVGDDAASQVYVRSKAKAAAEAGIASIEHRLPASAGQATLLDLVASLNADDSVDGILVQLPLPSQIDTAIIIQAIDPAKDVDGFHAANVGRMAIGLDALAPCTPLGCMILINEVLGPSLAGLNATVVGRSNIVGRPMAQMLLGADATVTVAHAHTRALDECCRDADILVTAVGKPGLIPGEWVKPGAVVIDVGINRIAAPERGADATRLVGDVDFDGALPRAGAITPVPGGVGPMTIACLLKNCLAAAHIRAGLTDSAT